MKADIEQTMGYSGEAEAFLRVTCGDLCETALFPISDKVSDQMVDKIISTINTQTADEIERLRRVEQAAKNMIKWWEDSGLIYNCGPVEEIRAALDNG